MNLAIQGELIARVERVKNDAILLLEALYYHCPQLSPKTRDELYVDTATKVFDFNGRWHDERGRFASLGNYAVSFRAAESHLHQLLDANTELSDHNKREYRETISTVLANMPPAAHRAILKSVKEIKAFDSVDELRKYGKARTGQDQRKTMAAWDFANGRLILDGGSEGASDTLAEPHHVRRGRYYAHEIAHSIDAGHKPPVSDTVAWKKAYDEEIRNSSNPNLLYAQQQKNPEKAYLESFAEIGRFFYSGGAAEIAQSTEYCKTYLPKCYAVFEEHQLIMRNENIKSSEEKWEVISDAKDTSRGVPEASENSSHKDSWHSDTFDSWPSEGAYGGLAPRSGEDDEPNATDETVSR